MTVKSCRVIPAGKREACGVPAPLTVTFPDGSRAGACQECALYLQQLAATQHGVRLKVERTEHAEHAERGSSAP